MFWALYFHDASFVKLSLRLTKKVKCSIPPLSVPLLYLLSAFTGFADEFLIFSIKITVIPPTSHKMTPRTHTYVHQMVSC